MLQITAHIKRYEDSIFVAYTDQFKGLVVQASSEEKVKQELVKSVRVKLAYDLNLPIHQVQQADDSSKIVEQEDGTLCLQVF